MSPRHPGLWQATRPLRDPNDNIVLECASLTNADPIVTGDRDLLVLGSYSATKIVAARQYVDSYS